MSGLAPLLRFARPHAGTYVIAVVSLALASLLFLLIPAQLGVLIESVSQSVATPTPLMHRLAPALNIGAILIVQALLAALYTYLVSTASERIGNQLKATFFDNAVARPIAAAPETSLGAIASEFSSDLGIIQGGLSDTLMNFLRHGTVTLGATVAMFWSSPTMATLILVCVAAIVGVIFLLMRVANRAVMKVQAGRAQTLGLLVECVSNAYVIQAYDRQGYFSDLFKDRLAKVYADTVNSVRLLAQVNPAGLAIFSLAMLGVLSYGLSEVAAGRTTVASLIAFVTYAMVLMASVSQVGVAFGQLQLAARMLDKHDAMLRPLPAATRDERSDAKAGARIPPAFNLHEVAFTYPHSTRQVLDGVDLHIPAGQITAIIGLSGSGKSTLAALIANLMQPSAGHIECVGAGRRLQAGDIAIVPQNPFLFAGSIAENIAFGRPWIGPQAIEQAAREAQIESYVAGLPKGMDHVIEEGGRNLSRGQQQRVALARALAGSPSVLILDEATASLDVVSERAINKVLNTIRGRVTIIVVTHQGDLLTSVDHLVLLESGRVSYAGPPAIAAAKGNALMSHVPQLVHTNT